MCSGLLQMWNNQRHEWAYSFCPHNLYCRDIPVLTFPLKDMKGLWNYPQFIPQTSQAFVLPSDPLLQYHILHRWHYRCGNVKFPLLK